MNTSKLRKNRRYKIKVRGFTLEFKDSLLVQNKLDQLLKSIPKDSQVELNLTKKDFFNAQIIIKGSSFGCNLKTTAPNFNILVKNIFQCTNEEISTWENSPYLYDEFAPYFGGYPSYYKEATFYN